jgi:glutaredoxin
MSSKYHLFVIVLKNCPYGNAALKLLEEKNCKNKIIKNITHEDKDMYKTSLIDTFPQIYLKKNDSKDSLLLGGYSDLKEVYDNFYNLNYDESKEKINKFIEEKKWAKKSTLRLITLINE